LVFVRTGTRYCLEAADVRDRIYMRKERLTSRPVFKAIADHLLEHAWERRDLIREAPMTGVMEKQRAKNASAAKALLAWLILWRASRECSTEERIKMLAVERANDRHEARVGAQPHLAEAHWRHSRGGDEGPARG